MDNNESSDTFFQEGYGVGPFQMMNEIGKGQFGKVYIGIHGETKEKVAIKQIPKSDKNIDINLIKAEINIQKKLFHPYICKMYCVIENPDYMFIVTEYCGGGEIFKKILDQDAPFEEKTACKIFTQILSSIEYLHNNYICHRDIKLENMLFDDYGDAKLTDFGLSKSFEGDITFDKAVGSAMYSAPEIFKRKPYIGRNADIWSLGICLYVMVCGEYPFQGEDVKDFLIHLNDDNFTVPESVSPEFKDLIYKILEKNPTKRLTIEQIKQHNWLHMCDFNFMKSPGIIIKKDILPIDINIIKEIVGNNETKIKNTITDILMNKHNNNTISYYLKVESIKRKKIISVSDIRPSSELFIKYINDEKSKLIYYDNNINKKIDELVKYILNEFKMEELKIRENIKNSLNIGKTTTDAEPNNKINNKNNINDNNIKVNKNIKINKKFNKLLSKTYRKFDFKEIFKKQEEEKKIQKEKKEEKIKQNKFELLKHYIGPLLFAHDLIDEIITKVIILKNNKEIKKKFIPVNNSSLNVLSTKPKNIMTSLNIENNNSTINILDNNKKQRFLNFSINSIEEIEYPGASTLAEKTFTNGFKEQTKNNDQNKSIIKIIKRRETERKNNKKNENELTKNQKSKKTIPDHKNEKPVNDVKNNNNKKYDKKKLTHLQKNKSDLSSILKNNKSKVIKEFKDKIEKKGILNKSNKKIKRSLSQEKTRKNINKLNDEEINKILKEKYKNKSEKKLNRKNNLFQNDKKEKKNDINYVKKRKISSNNNDNKNLDENLNINEILSEKRENKKNLNSIKEEKPSKHKRNLNSSQINFYHKKPINSTINSERKRKNTMTLSSSQKRMDSGRKASITKNKNIESIKEVSNIKENKDKNKENTKDKSSLNKTNKKSHQRTQTTPVKMTESARKNKEIKSTVFTYKKNQKVTSQTGRNQRKQDLLEKNISTKDSSVKKQSDINDQNSGFKSIKSSSIHLKTNLMKKLVEKDDTNNNNKGGKQNEIKTKKNENLVKTIITDHTGNNNTTISNISKEHTRFACKMYFGKKKIVFNLNLFQKGKNKYIITGEFIEGDIKSYEKLFEQIKEKLE